MTGVIVPSAVLWDLDGTLVDSLGDIAAALNHALVAVGQPALSEDLVRACVGEGARHLVEQALPAEARMPATIDEALGLYRSRYRANLVVRTRAYPGIEALAHSLRGRGVPMGVVTNKPHAPACEIVERIFGTGLFGVVIGEEEGRARKPDPAPVRLAAESLGVSLDEAVLVGDSAIDLETARRAGIRGIGVAWGIRGRTELETIEGAEIVDDAAALARALGL